MATGLKIVPPGVTFSNYIDISDYPVTQDLSALFKLGVDAATSMTNLATGGANASAAGASVTYAANYATFSGDPTNAANFIQTAEPDGASADFTRVALFQRMDATERPVCGIFGAVGSGSGMLQSQAFYATGSALVSKSFGLPASASGSFQFVAEKFAASSNTLTAYMGSGGALVNLGSVSGAARVAHTVAERIGGSSGSASFSGTSRISLVAKHRSALTDQQIADIFAYIKFYAARRSLTLA